MGIPLRESDPRAAGRLNSSINIHLAHRGFVRCDDGIARPVVPERSRQPGLQIFHLGDRRDTPLLRTRFVLRVVREKIAAVILPEIAVEHRRSEQQQNAVLQRRHPAPRRPRLRYFVTSDVITLSSFSSSASSFMKSGAYGTATPR